MNEWKDHINEILNGSINDYEPIIIFHEEKLHQFILLLVRDEKLAKEWTVNTLEYVYKVLPSFKKQSREDFDNWFILTAVAFIFNQLESIKRPHNTKEVSGTNREIDRYFIQLPIHTQQALLLARIFNLSPQSISLLIGSSVEEIKQSLFSIPEELVQKQLPENHESPCLDNNSLYLYVTSSDQIEETEDHLEFCPTCRERLQQLKRILNGWNAYFNSHGLSESLKTEVLEKLDPYKRQKVKKPLSYQLISVAFVLVIGALLINTMPHLSNWKTLAGNYLSHGEFYNVWDKGTYIATDREISFEITGMEMSPILTRVDFEINSERELVENQSPTGSQLIDISKPGLVSLKTKEELYPIRVISAISKNDELTKGSFYLDLNRIEDLVLPEEFELVFNSTRVGGVLGQWEITLPVQYQNGLVSMEETELGQTVNLNDKVKIDLENFLHSETGSLLDFSYEFTYQEKDRIIKRYEELRRKEGYGYFWNHPQITTDIKVENEAGEELLFHSTYNPPQDNVPLDNKVESAIPTIETVNLYHNYFVDLATGNTTRALEKGEKLYARINEVTYSEFAGFELSIDLKEAERTPINKEYEGTSIDYYTIKRLEADQDNPERYEVKIIGSHESDTFITRFQWFLGSFDGNPPDHVSFQANWEDFYETPVFQDPNTLYHFEIPLNQPLGLPESFTLTAYEASYHFRVENLERIPLFRE
ncbi:anti-sigma factor family protein [Sutcliffiella deserti]|uniref:anti-sigma factor family protein n=1 Tax=Sutcliffiella deserti TaxID=2875501 RepID=UPI001CC08ECE|nr:hypothetical protein [Sutcliffiella deserti]